MHPSAPGAPVAFRLTRPVLILTLLLTLGPAPATSAQSAEPPAQPAFRQTRPAPAPLNSSELSTLQTLFPKVRPATLRIEDCPPNDCTDPDGVGTAFLISDDGLALTAYHVVFDAKNLSAVTVDRKRYKVEVLGFDDQRDVALLRVNVPKGTPFLPLATARPQIGETALAVGNGAGAFLQAKTGRLIGLDADAGRADFPAGTLELTAPLRPGDSGGPVLNPRGEVTGVVSFITVQGRNQDITSYAVPVTANDSLVADLQRGVKREAPVIGISLSGNFMLLTELSAEDFKEANELLKLGLGDTPGAFFTGVTPGSPAAQAGLQALRYDPQGRKLAGDVVTAVNGKRIVNFSQFQYAVRSYQPGDTVTLTVLRGSQTLNVKMTLAGRSSLRN
ncbi:S1C family serine protease [Deinococcus deserti]|uniref:Putative Peptidase S1 and S6, chymotrypsin/Hap n=1 Tax=Deinococcus deserti (strain DSM 17065 / CIP 109153 / LMG 22923 / VCD115) TaxID=546414 RepID=C1CY96_DEIDV|nr:S1C family serine protease [Deinococcus deserti]ACO44917.1 putative Peptidase S1 and S6, chymotrypsin/Hap precursor [Deinococcus deserti VCD115]